MRRPQPGRRAPGRQVERDRQFTAGRSMRSTVYTGKMSSCRFSSRPSLPSTVKIVGRPAKGFPAGVTPGLSAKATYFGCAGPGLFLSRPPFCKY